MMNIVRNLAQCKACGDIIESQSEHDVQTCTCGNLSVDGGLTHLSRTSHQHDSWVELAEFSEDSAQKIARMQSLVDEAIENGFGTRSMRELHEEGRRLTIEELRERFERAREEERNGTLIDGEELMNQLARLDELLQQYSDDEAMRELFIDGALWLEALDYFQSEEKAIRWFKAPLLALGGETPGSYCLKHDNGHQVVKELIIQLKHGLTA